MSATLPGVWVKGEVSATPLRLAQGIDRVLSRLRLAGWEVMGYRADTSAEGLAGLLPRARMVEVRLHRSAPYERKDAEEALSRAVSGEGFSLRLAAEYVEEVTTEIVEPTMRDAGAVVTKGADALAAGLGLPPWAWRVGLVALFGGAAWFYLSPLLPKRKP